MLPSSFELLSMLTFVVLLAEKLWLCELRPLFIDLPRALSMETSLALTTCRVLTDLEPDFCFSGMILSSTDFLTSMIAIGGAFELALVAGLNGPTLVADCYWTGATVIACCFGYYAEVATGESVLFAGDIGF